MKQLRAKLYEREMDVRRAEAQALEDSKADIGWGSQIGRMYWIPVVLRIYGPVSKRPTRKQCLMALWIHLLKLV